MKRATRRVYYLAIGIAVLFLLGYSMPVGADVPTLVRLSFWVPPERLSSLVVLVEGQVERAIGRPNEPWRRSRRHSRAFLCLHVGATASGVWSPNRTIEAKVPDWGFSSSPLVVDDVVIVAVAGALVAYALASGDLRWSGADGGDSYSSPYLLTIDGVAQVLLLSAAGAISVAPTDGKLLWEHSWPSGMRIVQPALTTDGNILIVGGERNGIRRIAVAHRAGQWTIEERWTSAQLKPTLATSPFIMATPTASTVASSRVST